LFLHSVGLAFPPVQSADYLYSLISSFMCKKIFGSDCTKQQKGVKYSKFCFLYLIKFLTLLTESDAMQFPCEICSGYESIIDGLNWNSIMSHVIRF
jgi:hypothetical protein